MLVGRGDVGRERGDGQPVGGHRRRPRAFHAGESRRRHFHRSLEAPTTTRVLRAIFADATHFVVHDPLPAAPQFGDEGAANHTRFAAAPTAPGVELFVYGRARATARGAGAARYPGAPDARGVGRPSRAATASTRRARVFAQQNPRRDRRRRVPQRRDRRRPRQRRCSATSARGVDQHAVLAELARARRRRRSRRSSSASASVSVADAVAHLSLQQPAAAARRRRAAARRARRVPRESRASPRISTRCSRSGGPIAEVLDVRPAAEHAQRRRARVPAAARRADDGGARGDRARNVFLDDALAGDARRVDPPPLPRPARAGGPRRSGAARRIAPRARRAVAAAAPRQRLPVPAASGPARDDRAASGRCAGSRSW